MARRKLKLKDPRWIADTLAMYNRWRRGQREFEWSEDPSANVPFPFTAVELGRIIDEAIGMLYSIKPKKP